VLGQLGDAGVELAGLEGALRVGGGVGLEPLEVLGRHHRGRAAGGRAALGDEGIAQDPQQVAEVVVAAHEARLGEHAHAHVLDEVLGVGGRAGHAEGGAVEAVEMVSEAVRVKDVRDTDCARAALGGSAEGGGKGERRHGSPRSQRHSP
jgi:hypothetical protein